MTINAHSMKRVLRESLSLALLGLAAITAIASDAAPDFRSGEFHQWIEWTDDSSSVVWRGLFLHRHSPESQDGQLLLVGEDGTRISMTSSLQAGRGERVTKVHFLGAGYEATCIDRYGQSFDHLGEMLRFEPRDDQTASRTFVDSLGRRYQRDVPAVDLIFDVERAESFEDLARSAIEPAGKPEVKTDWGVLSIEVRGLLRLLSKDGESGLGDLFDCPMRIAAAGPSPTDSALTAKIGRPSKGAKPTGEDGTALLSVFDRNSLLPLQ